MPSMHATQHPATQVPLEECTIDLESGNPFLYEDYWIRHPQPALIMQPSAHMGYMTSYSPLPRLLAGIQNVHSMVGLVHHSAAASLACSQPLVPALHTGTSDRMHRMSGGRSCEGHSRVMLHLLPWTACHAAFAQPRLQARPPGSSHAPCLLLRQPIQSSSSVSGWAPHGEGASADLSTLNPHVNCNCCLPTSNLFMFTAKMQQASCLTLAPEP